MTRLALWLACHGVLILWPLATAYALFGLLEKPAPRRD